MLQEEGEEAPTSSTSFICGEHPRHKPLLGANHIST